ncbi:MAG TPA: TVP38/TMEM64 family protein [Planctomycetes bacterium]|nr:TVP38/TMEM64 family protein [Planctomycetota bacterium]
MKKAIVLLLVIAVAVAVWFLFLQDNISESFDWVRAQGLLGAVVVALAYALATVLMIPGSIATLAIGAIYGPWLGLAIVSPASVLGATVAFLLGRGAFRPVIEKKMGTSEKFAALQTAIVQQGFKILTLVRLSPLFPFTLINYAFGITRISLRHYVLGSFLGMLPGTLLYVYLGSAVGDVGKLISEGVEDAGQAGDIMFYGGLLATLIVSIIIARIAKRALAEATAPHQR